MMPFDQFKDAADAIPYQYRHPEFLYSLIKWLRPKVVVEVGTHIGMSAVWMGRALQENAEGARLFCIDSFCWSDQPSQEQQWYANIEACGVGCGPVSLVKGRSQEVQWPERVDFAYIDGNHTFEVCKHDVEKAEKLGATCIVLNDISTCEGVQMQCHDMRHWWETWDYIEVPFDAGLFVALKRQSLPEPTQGNVDQWDKP